MGRRCSRRRIGVVDVDPLHGQPPADALTLAHVEARVLAHGEHLQQAALGQPLRVLRDIAVEARAAAGAGILGLVDDAAARVDRDRLVREAAGRADRFALLELARAARDRHLEQVAVWLGELLRRVCVLGTGDALLGRDPAAQPKAAAPGAVHRGAVEAHEVRHEPPPMLVVDERGGAAAAIGVIAGRRVAAHAAPVRRIAILAVFARAAPGCGGCPGRRSSRRGRAESGCRRTSWSPNG